MNSIYRIWETSLIHGVGVDARLDLGRLRGLDVGKVAPHIVACGVALRKARCRLSSKRRKDTTCSFLVYVRAPAAMGVPSESLGEKIKTDIRPVCPQILTSPGYLRK